MLGSIMCERLIEVNRKARSSEVLQKRMCSLTNGEVRSFCHYGVNVKMVVICYKVDVKAGVQIYRVLQFTLLLYY